MSRFLISWLLYKREVLFHPLTPASGGNKNVLPRRVEIKRFFPSGGNKKVVP